MAKWNVVKCVVPAVELINCLNLFKAQDRQFISCSRFATNDTKQYAPFFCECFILSSS